MRQLILFACFGICLQADIIDRLAITVGKQIITELQLDEEIRVTAFLNHQSVVRDLDSRRAAADRLIAQLLIQREMRLSRYPSAESKDVDNYLEQIRKSFGAPANFDQALANDDLTEAALREHLALQLSALQFIEYRFKPDAGTTDRAKRTDEALDAWLQENRKQVRIVDHDKSLE